MSSQGSDETNTNYCEIAKKILLLKVKKTFLTALKHYLLTTPSEALFVFEEYLDTIALFKGNDNNDLKFISGLKTKMRYSIAQEHKVMFNDICSYVRNYNNLALLKELLKFIDANPDIRHKKDNEFDPYYIPTYFGWS